MARLFVAVDLPADERARLAALGAEIAAQIPGARPTNPDQLHLTLRFLGATPDAEVDRVAAALERVSVPRFRLALAGVGRFGGRRGPGVVWAGVSPIDGLVACKAAVDQALGPDPEAGRGFTPHVTLARLTERGPRVDAQLLPYLSRHADLRGDAWEVDAFHLYDSQTKPGGAVHRLLGTYRLAGSTP